MTSPSVVFYTLFKYLFVLVYSWVNPSLDLMEQYSQGHFFYPYHFSCIFFHFIQGWVTEAAVWTETSMSMHTSSGSCGEILRCSHAPKRHSHFSVSWGLLPMGRNTEGAAALHWASSEWLSSSPDITLQRKLLVVMILNLVTTQISQP